MSSSNSIALLISIAVTLLYVFISIYKKQQAPELKDIIIFLTAVVVIYMSLTLMGTIIFSEGVELGVLEDQKLLII